MPFYVLKKYEENPYSNEHHGLTTLSGGLLYFMTALSKPTQFETEAAAREAIKKSKKEWPKAKFRVITLEEFEKEIQKKIEIKKPDNSGVNLNEEVPF